MKQMIQIEHNRITNPNGREAAPVGYLQAWPRIWTQDDWEQIQQVARPGNQTWDCRIESLTRWIIGCTAS